MEKTTRIVEIDGIKLEIDLRTAKKIEHFRVGDNVRVLVKSYSDNYKVHPGVIVGFDGFEKLPTICIAYLETSYNAAEVKFAYINAGKESKDCKIEITPAFDLDELHFKKSDVISTMQKLIDQKEAEKQDLILKMSYFTEHFSKYFEPKEKVSE